MAAVELELNLSTSTVNRHAKDLETHLGLTLCRQGRAGSQAMREPCMAWMR
jgi:hypothetical protein